MSIARSGTPFQAHNATAATTAAVTVPSTAAVGALGIIVAWWNTTTSAWGAAPSGWTVVPNYDQHGSAPASIAYSRLLTAADLGANVTVTGPASAANSVCAFAYSGSQGFDANASQRNAPATSCTAPAVTATGAADLLVMAGGAGSAATTFAAPTNSLSLWQATANSSTGIADRQLTGTGASGSSAMTIAAASANVGLQFTLFQLDGDGEGPSSSGARRLPMRPWSRAAQLSIAGRDERPFAPALTDESWTMPPPRFKPLRAVMPRPMIGADDQLYGAPAPDEPRRPPPPALRAFRVGNPAVADPPLITPAEEAPATARRMLWRFRPTGAAADGTPLFAPGSDDADTRLAVRLFAHLRPSRGNDEPPPVVPLADHATAGAARLRPFTVRTQPADDPPPFPFDDHARSIPRVFRRLRTAVVSAAEQTPFAGQPAPRRVRLARLRVPIFVTSADQPGSAVPVENAFVPSRRRWDRLRRWLSQMATDLGLAALPTGPSYRFAATLDRTIILAGAALNLTTTFDATLNPPLIFGATLG